MVRKLDGVLLLAVGLVSFLPVNTRAGNPLQGARDGLSVNQASALEGYVLVAPMNSRSTYLIDNDGRIVNEWKSDYTPALSAYLLPDGHLLRPGAEGGFMAGGPGVGGRIQKFDWDGSLVWDFSFRDAFPESKLRPHHDICPLPNGHVLVVCTDPKTREESIAAGRLPPLATDQLQSDAIIEIKPVGQTGGEIVWAWYAWDHLVQDVHKQKPGFADVSEHPELIDINYASGMMDRLMQNPEELAKLRSLGYVGGGTAAAPQRSHAGQVSGPRNGPGPGGPPGMQGDWLHVNSVAYNPDLDQIMISVHEFSEIWIIDHSTSIAEAASHSGGRSGKGGDLLYRWGNPRVYRSGTNADQRLFAQHCAHWIAAGLPGEGHMLVFNNGMNRPNGTYSSVDEVVLPVNPQGMYEKEEYVAYEPFQAHWSYGSPENTAFFSMLISGCQRLPNGNTFICSGNQGILFEVTPQGDVVWQYKHPGAGFGNPEQFQKIFTGIVPGFLNFMLGINKEQREKIDSLQARVDAELESLLTSDQQKKRNAGPGSPSRPGTDGRFPPPPRIGDVIPQFQREELALTDEQLGRLDRFQAEVTRELGQILTKQQLEKIKRMEQRPAEGGPPGFGPPQGFGPPGAFGGPPGQGGPGGPGGPGGIFRAYKYGADYPGLRGRHLTPGMKLEEVAASDAHPQENGPPFQGRNNRQQRSPN